MIELEIFSMFIQHKLRNISRFFICVMLQCFKCGQYDIMHSIISHYLITVNRKEKPRNVLATVLYTSVIKLTKTSVIYNFVPEALQATV